jgi:hypothetical protein
MKQCAGCTRMIPDDPRHPLCYPCASIMMDESKTGEAAEVLDSGTSTNQVEGESAKLLPPHHVYLKLIETPEERKLFGEIVEKYHSYTPIRHYAGRQVNYLIMVNGKPMGSIGIGSATVPTSHYITQYISKIFPLPVATNPHNRGRLLLIKPYFNMIANNWRFTVTPDFPKGYGSKVLGLLCRIGPKHWQQKYGDPLKFIYTFVTIEKSGTVYTAAGWDKIGQTYPVSRRARGFRSFHKDPPKKSNPIVGRKWIFIKEIK